MQIISRLNLAEVEDVEMDKKVENAIYIHFNIRQNRLHDMELLLPPAVTWHKIIGEGWRASGRLARGRERMAEVVKHEQLFI